MTSEFVHDSNIESALIFILTRMHMLNLLLMHAYQTASTVATFAVHVQAKVAVVGQAGPWSIMVNLLH